MSIIMTTWNLGHFSIKKPISTDLNLFFLLVPLKTTFQNKPKMVFKTTSEHSKGGLNSKILWPFKTACFWVSDWQYSLCGQSHVKAILNKKQTTHKSREMLTRSISNAFTFHTKQAYNCKWCITPCEKAHHEVLHWLLCHLTPLCTTMTLTNFNNVEFIV